MRTREHEVYLSDFARLERDGWWKGPDWLRRLRSSAMEHFADRGFPTPREEDWKYTNVAPLAKRRFEPVLQYAPDGLAHRLSGPLAFAQLAGGRLVFVNGHFAADLSSVPSLPGRAHVGALSAAIMDQGDIASEHVGRHAVLEQSPFVALNTAFLREGAFLYVPAGVVLQEPIHLVFLSHSAQEGVVSHPRNLVVLERAAEATVIETYVGSDTEAYFTNAVTEVVVGDGAILDHCKLLREGLGAFHVGTVQVAHGRDSTLRSFSVAMGAQLARNDLNVVLGGEGGDCALDGLYVASGQQHVDHHTLIDHQKPRCTSRQLYKGVLGGNATAVFNGKIVVRRDAQVTDAEQTNKNLLLSETAAVDTKPQLEIFADDVRCTHGAAVGPPDAQSLFYLQTRGLGKEEGTALLAYGFAADVLRRLRDERLRTALDLMVMERVRVAFQAGEMA